MHFKIRQRKGFSTIEYAIFMIILMTAISPDLDLLDTSDVFNPGQDGENDSFSIGLGFTCTPATFIPPAN